MWTEMCVPVRRASRVSRAFLCSKRDLSNASRCTIKYGFRHHGAVLREEARDLIFAAEPAWRRVNQQETSIADPLFRQLRRQLRSDAVRDSREICRLNPKLVF